MLGELVDTVGEDGDLNGGGTGVLLVLAVLLDELGLALLGDGPDDTFLSRSPQTGIDAGVNARPSEGYLQTFRRVARIRRKHDKNTSWAAKNECDVPPASAFRRNERAHGNALRQMPFRRTAIL